MSGTWLGNALISACSDDTLHMHVDNIIAKVHSLILTIYLHGLVIKLCDLQ